MRNNYAQIVLAGIPAVAVIFSTAARLQFDFDSIVIQLAI